MFYLLVSYGAKLTNLYDGENLLDIAIAWIIMILLYTL